MQGFFLSGFGDMHILIVYASSGRGLQKDALILEQALSAMGHSCQPINLSPRPEWRSRLSQYRHKLIGQFLPDSLQSLYYRCRLLLQRFVPGKPSANIVIHLENIHTAYLPIRAKHWLIPNQEWFVESRTPYLRYIDQVLCKTQVAVSIFSRLHTNAVYLGFSGLPTQAGPAPADKNYHQAIHVAGNSQFKGTATLVACWLKHPEWPTLVVVSQHVTKADSKAENIVFLQNLTDEALANYWCQSGFAVIPSEVEGYGQVLAEAMSYGCVTVTTDAPPMNELIRENRGFLVPYSETRKFRLGTRYLVSIEALETALQKALATSEEDLERMSGIAESWHQSNQADFLNRLRAVTAQQAY